jgi:hypothetical protein
MLSGQPPDTASAKTRDHVAQGRANAAIALIALGYPDRGWTLLERGEDPEARTDLIHGIRPGGIPPDTIIDGITRSKSHGVLQALILVLGEYEEHSLPPAMRMTVVQLLSTFYRGHTDAGVHSSVEWLLRKWGYDAIVEQYDQDLALVPRDSDRRWYAGPMAHTFSIVIATKNWAAGTEWPRGRKTMWVDHAFAISTKETTFGQYLRSSPGAPGSIPPETRADQPAAPVTLFEAMRYCRG